LAGPTGETGEAATEKGSKKPEEDIHSISMVLNDDNTPCMNQNLLQGFSFIDYKVKRK
jgi:hypothetical protein